MSVVDPVIRDYEVFKNAHDALAFFFYQNPVLDHNPAEGPFAFSVQDNSILAGTSAHHVIFADVTPEIIDLARNRGVLMMMEFEGQQPVRCTPCYFTEAF